VTCVRSSGSFCSFVPRRFEQAVVAAGIQLQRVCVCVCVCVCVWFCTDVMSALIACVP
jgi:hypothetical protein